MSVETAQLFKLDV